MSKNRNYCVLGFGRGENLNKNHVIFVQLQRHRIDNNIWAQIIKFANNMKNIILAHPLP